MKPNCKSQAGTKADSEQKDEDLFVCQHNVKPNVVRSPKSTYVCPYSDLSIGILQKDGSIKPTSFLYKNIHEFLRRRSLGLVDT